MLQVYFLFLGAILVNEIISKGQNHELLGIICV
jgi:hypothetical protein